MMSVERRKTKTSPVGVQTEKMD